jgi:hypothetical protein
MADAHLEKNTTSLHEDLKSDNTHTVAEHGHAATDMYDSLALSYYYCYDTLLNSH